MSTSLQDSLQTLLALQAVDSQIQRVTKAQKALDDGTVSLAAARAAKAAHESAVTELHHAAGELKDSELKLSAVETKRKLYEQKLYQGTITNAKELTNIEKEIAALGRQQSDLDEQVLIRMDAADSCKIVADAAAIALASATDKHKEIVANYQANYKELDRQLGLLKGEREVAAAAVQDRALLKRYDEMRPKMNGLAIVSITGGDCGGCHMTLPGSLVKLIREGDAMQTCENCRRILVY